MNSAKILNRSSNTMTLSNFYEFYQLEKFNFEPPYQRYSVWTDEKKSYFIDSILRNFPVPPIFLRQIVDSDTGRTKFDVIDGKQRLSSIIDFIEGNIFSSSDILPSSSTSTEIYDDRINGLYFSDLDSYEGYDLKKQFWTYSIPVEYINVADDSNDIIENIFDRLNRNGEALTGQELRNAKYHNSELVKLVNTIYEENMFWQERLEVTDARRMEHIEFLSELLFMMLENKPLGANSNILDKYYAKYAEVNDMKKVYTYFKSISQYMMSLNLHYDDYKISGVSHLYGVWGFSMICLSNGVMNGKLVRSVNRFFEELREKEIHNEDVKSYKESMSSRTKSDTQRKKRINSLLNYFDLGKYSI